MPLSKPRRQTEIYQRRIQSAGMFYPCLGRNGQKKRRHIAMAPDSSVDAPLLWKGATSAADLLLHDLAGFCTGRFQRGHGRLFTRQRVSQLLMEHVTNFRIIFHPEPQRGSVCASRMRGDQV